MQLLAASSGFNCIILLFIRAEEICLSFERDLRTPFPGAFVLIHAGHAAGVCREQPAVYRLQNGNGRAIAELEIF